MLFSEEYKGNNKSIYYNYVIRNVLIFVNGGIIKEVSVYVKIDWLDRVF